MTNGRGWMAAAVLSCAACASPRGMEAPPEHDAAPPPPVARAAARDPAPSPAAAGRVVVVELFSSEGCSSCPPADALLRQVSGAARADGAVVVGLEHHVDYWDRLGWKDPFSSSAATGRQSRYADARGGDSVFTPEAVVDGVTSLVGSRRDALDAAIRARAARPALPLRARLAEGSRSVHVELDDAPGTAADLVVAITESGLSTAVPAGENAGETLRHGPVVRWIATVGRATPGAVDVEVDAGPPGAERTIVAMVQARPQGEILGAAIAVAR